MSAPFTVVRLVVPGSLLLRRVLTLALFALAGVLPFRSTAQNSSLLPFIEKHCADCHDDVMREANLDLLQLGSLPRNESNLWIWIKVHDRVKAGEMPPKKKARPDSTDLAAFLKELSDELITTERALVEKNGRAVKRRLNSYEYENTLRDLLGVPWIQIKERFPEDGEKHRFNKVGEALDISHVQMARYMSSADYAIRQAMSAHLEHRDAATNRYYARDEFSLTANFRPRENGTLSDRLSFPVLNSRAQPDVRAGRAPVSSPETRELEAVGRVSSIFSDAGGYSWGQFRAPVAGRYRLRFKGYTIWVSGGGISRWFYEGFGEEKSPLYYLPLWHRPNLDEVWPGRRPEPIGVYASSSGQNRPLGQFDFNPEPTVCELEVLLGANEVIRTDGMRLFRTRVNGSDEQYVNPLAQHDGMPGYAVQWMEVEGPLVTDFQGIGYRRLFGELPLKRLSEGEAGGIALETVAPPGPAGPRPSGVGGGRSGPPGNRAGRGSGPRLVRVEVMTEQPQEDAKRLITAFLNRAYRRPATEADAQLFIGLFQQQFERGIGFASSMVAAYTAILSSPGFLFFDEAPGPLNDHALASRLSYFLWNSEPDNRLRTLAERGELRRPAVLKAEAERLLSSTQSRRFVEAFTDYWLDLRKVDDTSPSTTLYNDYELDDPLKLATIEETRLFVEELIRADLPARNIVESDFTFLNERLAEHYGFEDVKGTAMRKHTLPKESVRGGLMTQASVLKVTANGTTTSPVLRGNWITERILGRETPPPPPVPAVEPDIRGAVTIRQQLERHRADPSCASCHSRMDPPGFALESFDIMGGWRDKYRAVKEGVSPEPGIGMDGQRFAFYYALQVDSSGELPDGRTFRDVRDLKRLLLEDEAAIARNLVRQLAIYATGAPVRFSDQEAIEKMLKNTERGGYGVRSLVLELVQSPMFLVK